MKKQIPNFSGYYVDDQGNVWSRRKIKGNGYGGGSVSVLTKRFRKLKLQPNWNTKYLSISLRNDQGTHIGKLVHHLVLEAYVGPCPPGMECRHLDGNPKNNRLENLCWGTIKQNREDARRHGTLNVGERNGFAKLTNKQAKDILTLYRSGQGPTAIARQLEIKVGLVRKVCWGTTFSHIRPAGISHDRKTRALRGEQHIKAKLTTREVISIRELYATGDYSYGDLAKQFHISKENIGDVIKRRTWNHV